MIHEVIEITGQTIMTIITIHCHYTEARSDACLCFVGEIQIPDIRPYRN
jgi:hypothetical protein